MALNSCHIYIPAVFRVNDEQNTSLTEMNWQQCQFQGIKGHLCIYAVMDGSI